MRPELRSVPESQPYYVFEYLVAVESIGQAFCHDQLYFVQLSIKLGIPKVIFYSTEMKTIRTKQFVDKIKGHRNPVIRLYSPMGPSGHLLYSASSDGLIFVWDTSSKQIVHKSQLALPEGKQNQQLNLTCVDFSENIVYGSLSTGEIYSWNIKENTIVGKFLHHKLEVLHIEKINPRVLMSAPRDKELVMWDTVSGTLETRYLLDGIVNSVTVNGNLVYILCDRRTLSVLDLNKSELLFNQILPINKYYIKVATTKRYLILFSHDFDVEIYELPYQPGKKPKGTILMAYTSVNDVLQCQDQLIFACHDQTLRYISKELIEVDRYEGHQSSINCVELCSSMLYTGSSDFSIRSWDLIQIARQQRERRQMQKQELDSKKYEIYLKIKSKKRKCKKKKKKS